MVETTTLAYLAGMIDGDGYISITRSERDGKLYFAPQIGIAGTRREPHDLAASIWGGKVSCYAPKNPKHRIQYQWSRVGQAAVEAIRAIYPYLLVKRDHAELALDFAVELDCARSDDPFPWFGPHYDPTTAFNEMREWMVEMNQSRNRARRTWSEVPQ